MNVSGNLLPHGTTLQNGSIGIVNGQLNMSQAILTIDNSTLTVGSALGGGPNEILLTNGAKFNVAGNFSNDQGGFDVVGGSSAFIGGNFSIGNMPISVDHSTLTVGGSFGNGDSTTRVQNGASLVYWTRFHQFGCDFCFAPKWRKLGNGGGQLHKRFRCCHYSQYLKCK
jgi:hypothetical protein